MPISTRIPADTPGVEGSSLSVEIPTEIQYGTTNREYLGLFFAVIPTVQPAFPLSNCITYGELQTEPSECLPTFQLHYIQRVTQKGASEWIPTFQLPCIENRPVE